MLLVVRPNEITRSADVAAEALLFDAENSAERRFVPLERAAIRLAVPPVVKTTGLPPIATPLSKNVTVPGSGFVTVAKRLYTFAPPAGVALSVMIGGGTTSSVTAGFGAGLEPLAHARGSERSRDCQKLSRNVCEMRLDANHLAGPFFWGPSHMIYAEICFCYSSYDFARELLESS